MLRSGRFIVNAEKLEFFLEITERQRALQIERSSKKADAIFTEQDMKEIYGHWMQEDGWMNKKTAFTYNKLQKIGAKQKAHQLRRSAFSAYLFQIIGSKPLLLAAIQYPVFSPVEPDANGSSRSAEQAAAMLKLFIKGWKEEKESKWYHKRKWISKPKTWKRAGAKLAAHGARLDMVPHGERKWTDLDETYVWLLKRYKSGIPHYKRIKVDKKYGWNRAMRCKAGCAGASVGCSKRKRL